MTDNKKLLKEFANIYSSCNKAKQGALAEIGKIDEKYRKLAEEEKKQLNELVKALESQMEMYGNYLGLNKTEEPAKEEVVEEEEEEEIKDTIFPENNEKKEASASEEKEMAEETVSEESEEEKKANEFSDVWPEESETAPAEEKKEEDEWPAFPEEWN